MIALQQSDRTTKPGTTVQDNVSTFESVKLLYIFDETCHVYGNKEYMIAMSLPHRCGGILAHYSLQNCFNSATLEGF